MAALVVSVLVACDDGEKRPPPSRSRSDAVVTTGGGSARASAKPSATASAAKPKAPRKVCTKRPEGLKTPEGRVAIAKAAGAGALPNPVPFGAGKWIWVNLWAAWCEPCKEEMPRLRKWHADLRKAGVLIDLAFVSIDDDDRQLQRFLDGQPADGLRISYWLKEGSRAGWLKPFGLKPEPQLPVHVLVRPKGEVACVIHGAVEATDYPQLAKLIGSP